MEFDPFSHLSYRFFSAPPYETMYMTINDRDVRAAVANTFPPSSVSIPAPPKKQRSCVVGDEAINPDAFDNGVKAFAF